MESHPLNLAHQQHRRAEAHLINNRYDDAIQCHHNAAELLLDAMKSTTSSIALESITLQHSYHLKQKDLIKIKKGQYERVKKALDHLKGLGKDPTFNIQGSESAKVQLAIYRTINETDSLLYALLNKSCEPAPVKDVAADIVDGRKVNKSQETVVEELQILNQNLHTLIEQLVIQVEVLKDDNLTLKDRVSYLEKERVRYLNLPSAQGDIMQRNPPYTSPGSDELSKENIKKMPTGKETLSNKPGNTIDKTGHFDLSALKDI